MALDSNDIMEAARKRVIALREEGKHLDRVSIIRQIASELASSANLNIRRSEGMIEHLVSRGVEQGLAAKVEVIRKEEVALSAREKKMAEERIREWINQQGYDPMDPEYHQAYRRELDKLEERMLEKKKKLIDERKGKKPEPKPVIEEIPKKLPFKEFLADPSKAHKWMEKYNKAWYEEYFKHFDPRREDAHVRAVSLSAPDQKVRAAAKKELNRRVAERANAATLPMVKKKPRKPPHPK